MIRAALALLALMAACAPKPRPAVSPMMRHMQEAVDRRPGYFPHPLDRSGACPICRGGGPKND
jgi:hypothetical protein